MAFVDGDVVALRDAEVLRYEAQHVELGLVEFTVGTTDTEEEVNHVVASVVVGINLDLHTNLIDGDILLDKLLQYLEHLLSILFTVVLQEEALDKCQFALFHLSVGFHHGSDEHHEGHVNVGLGASVPVRAAVGTLRIDKFLGRAVGREDIAKDIAEEASDGASDGPPEAGEDYLCDYTHNLLIKKPIENRLDAGAGVHPSQEIGLSGRMDTVGEKDIDELGVGVNPYHGTGETGVTERVLRSFGACLGVRGGVEELLVESQSAAVALIGKMAAGEESDGFGLEVVFSVIEAVIEKHLHNLGQFIGCREKAGMSAHTTHGIGIGVVDGTVDETTETVDLGGSNTADINTIADGIEHCGGESHGMVEVLSDKKVERLAGNTLDDIAEEHKAKVAIKHTFFLIERTFRH